MLWTVKWICKKAKPNLAVKQDFHIPNSILNREKVHVTLCRKPYPFLECHVLIEWPVSRFSRIRPDFLWSGAFRSPLKMQGEVYFPFHSFVRIKNLHIFAAKLHFWLNLYCIRRLRRIINFDAEKYGSIDCFYCTQFWIFYFSDSPHHSAVRQYPPVGRGNWKQVKKYCRLNVI